MLYEVITVAGIFGQLAVPDLDNAGDNLVEKEAVVGDQYHAAGVV